MDWLPVTNSVLRHGMAHSGWVVRLTYACRQAVAGAVAGGPGCVVRLTYACRQAVAGAVAMVRVQSGWWIVAGGPGMAVAGGPGMTVAGGPGMAVAGGRGMAVAGGPGMSQVQNELLQLFYGMEGAQRTFIITV